MTTNPQSLSVSSEEEYDDDAANHQGASWPVQQTDPNNSSSVLDRSQPSPGQGNRPSLPVQKRRRVTRACDECRRKKIKCDGKQPCTHCTVYSYECTYDQPSNRRRNPGPHYIEALELKLQRAEAVLKSVYPDIDLEDPSIDEQFALDQSQTSKADGRSSEQRRAGAWLSHAKSRGGVDGEKDSMLESMIQDTGSLDLDDEGYWDFYGSSSGRVFLRKMRQQLGDLIGKPETLGLPQLPSRESTQAMSSPASSSAGSPWASRWPNTSELPPRKCARFLCSNALDDACAILRFVHQPSFYAMFDRVYDTRQEDLDPEELKFVPLLYSVLALGSLFATGERSELQARGLENAIEQGTHWFRTARSMMDISECRDLTSLQTLLFMILFLQSSAKLSTCYSYIGTVLRSALRMGLHRSVSTRFNPIEQELRKRIFWCVRKLDIYVGAMLGLPRMLNDDDIDQEFPIEVDDEYITNETILPMPPGKPSLMAAFNAHTRIVVVVLAKTVAYVYPIKGTKSKSNQSYIVSHARIREIEQDLEKWYEQLPEAFRPGGDAPKEFIRIQHLLRMAYAHIEMFLYRPFLHYVSQDVQAKSFDKRSYACAAACVSVARNIVHLASDMKKKGLLIGSYWFYMYTTFFAVISLVFYVIENPHSATSAEILRDAYEGRDTLASLATRSLAAENCIKTFADLFDQLPERLKGARMNSAPQKKRQAPSGLPVSQPQLLQSAPDMRPKKPDPDLSVRRSHTSPSLQGPWTVSSGQFDAAAFQPQMSQASDQNYRRNSQDPLSPTHPTSSTVTPNTPGGNVSATPPFDMQPNLTGLEVPDLSAMMFPSEDPFAYPNQPITTLENRQEIKQEGLEGVYQMDPSTTTTNAPYHENLDPRVYGSMPTYVIPNQTPTYSMQGVSQPLPLGDPRARQDTMPMSGPGWPQQSSDQRADGEPGIPMGQMYGEDWGGWMNQGYRQ